LVQVEGAFFKQPAGVDSGHTSRSSGYLGLAESGMAGSEHPTAISRHSFSIDPTDLFLHRSIHSAAPDRANSSRLSQP